MDKTLVGAGFLTPARVTDNFSELSDGVEHGQVGASRPNLSFVGRTVGIVYEETKQSGTEGSGGAGRYVRYHAFDGFAFTTTTTTIGGVDRAVIDDGTAGAGYIVSDPTRSAKRPRITTQETPGPATGFNVLILFREGLEDAGGPGDAEARFGYLRAGDPLSTGLRPEDLWPTVDPASTTPAGAAGNARPLNLSSAAGLYADTEANPLENARGHRAVLRGDTIAFAYHYTADDAASRFEGTANYNCTSDAQRTAASRGTRPGTSRTSPTPPST